MARDAARTRRECVSFNDLANNPSINFEKVREALFTRMRCGARVSAELLLSARAGSGRNVAFLGYDFMITSAGSPDENATL